MDILVIKLDDGNTMTHFRPDQDYEKWGDSQGPAKTLDEMAAVLVNQHLPGRTHTSVALCDAEALETELKGGKDLDVDVDVKTKATAGAKKMIARKNKTPDELANADPVVVC